MTIVNVNIGFSLHNHHLSEPLDNMEVKVNGIEKVRGRRGNEGNMIFVPPPVLFL